MAVEAIGNSPVQQQSNGKTFSRRSTQIIAKSPMKKILLLSFSFLCFAALGVAGTITGQIQTPSTGRGVPNGTLTFSLSQVAVISGTATLAGNGNCWTDTNGSVVGLPGDAAVTAPVLSSNLGSGTLGAGTYFVRYTWSNATGESQPSAERSLP